MKKTSILLFTVLQLGTVIRSLQAQDRSELIPCHLTMQFAGNTGMWSMASGWQFYEQRLRAEAGLGYTPRFHARSDFYSVNLKGIYSPQRLLNGGSSTLRLINVGLAVSYAPGDEFSRYLDRDRYPRGYYWFHPWIRYGFVYQAGVYTGFARGPVKGAEFYLEASWWNQGIYSLYSNGNGSYLDLWDITLLGTGLRIYWR